MRLPCSLRRTSAFAALAAVPLLAGHQLSLALGSPLLGLIAVDLLLVSIASVWASLRQGCGKDRSPRPSG